MTVKHALTPGAALASALLLVAPASAAASNPLFHPPATYPNGAFGAGQGHGSLVSADLDGDGSTDLAVADAEGGAVRVLLNSGDGTFDGDVSYPTGFGAGSVAAADFDGDGHIDLAVTNTAATRFGPDGLVVLTNNGDGTFAESASYPTGSIPVQVKAADLNGDGLADLATVGAEPFENLVVLLNTGDGTFERSQTLSVGSFVVSLETADVDGDGNADLLVGDGPTGVLVLLGDGGGQVTPGTTVPADFGIEGFATGDLNADGITDVVIPQLLANKVSVHPGNGDGSFAPGVYSTVNPGANLFTFPPTINVAAGVADFDGDGTSDVAVSGGADSHLYVMTGDGLGGLTFAERHPVRVPRTIVPADLNDDGRTDIAVSGPETAVLLHR